MTPENTPKEDSVAVIADLVNNLQPPSRHTSDSSSDSGRGSSEFSKPEAPSRPPPKLSSERPSPAPRAVPRPAARSNPEPAAPPTKPVAPPTKPAAAPKPSLCKVELIAGDQVETISLSTSSNYIKLMDEVARKFTYQPDTFSLWYLNRQGSYTAIENQEVMEHVWKWKVKKNQLTVYVFGV